MSSVLKKMSKALGRVGAIAKATATALEAALRNNRSMQQDITQMASSLLKLECDRSNQSTSKSQQKKKKKRSIDSDSENAASEKSDTSDDTVDPADATSRSKKNAVPGPAAVDLTLDSEESSISKTSRGTGQKTKVVKKEGMGAAAAAAASNIVAAMVLTVTVWRSNGREPALQNISLDMDGILELFGGSIELSCEAIYEGKLTIFYECMVMK
jgi:hypothetical protein